MWMYRYVCVLAYTVYLYETQKQRPVDSGVSSGVFIENVQFGHSVLH